MLTQVLSTAWPWGLVGSVLFTGVLLIHHFWGPGPDVRDESGKRKKIAPEYRTFVAIEFLVIVSLLLACAVGAIKQLGTSSASESAITQVGVAYCVLFIVNLWDLVVIDLALVVRFRPKALVLPETAYFRTVKPHEVGWLAGNLYMAPLAGIAYLISMII